MGDNCMRGEDYTKIILLGCYRRIACENLDKHQGVQHPHPDVLYKAERFDYYTKAGGRAGVQSGKRATVALKLCEVGPRRPRRGSICRLP